MQHGCTYLKDFTLRNKKIILSANLSIISMLCRGGHIGDIYVIKVIIGHSAECTSVPTNILHICMYVLNHMVYKEFVWRYGILLSNQDSKTFFIFL